MIRSLRCGIALGVAVSTAVLPASAYAAVEITEIMYDPQGSDTGRDWIELYNPGSSPVVMTAGTKGWKINDGGNHLLVDPAAVQNDGGRGSLSISAGEAVIISSDPATFIAEYPSGSYSVIKSAISLNDTGATISIIDDSGTTQDSVSYTKSMGGYNDGNSLQLGSDGSWSAGPPTPGIFSGQASSTSGGSGSLSIDTNANEPVSPAPATPLPPAMTVDAGGDRTLEAGAGALFKGQIYGAEGMPIQNARYLWNFGDGETEEGQTVFYTYPYTGAYAVTLAVDAGNRYSAQGRIIVRVLEAQVLLSQQANGSLTVHNSMPAGMELDVGLWILSRGGKVFTIPQGTIILPGMEVRFSPNVLNLPAAADARLLYPNGTLAVAAEAAGNSNASGAANTAPSNSVPPIPAYRAAVKNPSVATEDVLTNASSSLPAAAAHSGAASPFWFSIAGLFALVALAGAGVLYARAPATGPVPQESSQHETDALAQEFTITEVEHLNSPS